MTKEKENKSTNEFNNNKNSTENDSKIQQKTSKNKKNKSTKNNQEQIKDDLINKDDELQNEIDALKDEKLRLLAEMENLRKRMEKDKIDSIKYGSANLARDILSPRDNLSRALDAIPFENEQNESIKNLIDGLKMVEKEFMTILEKHGVKRIEALKKKFDHNYHIALLKGCDVDQPRNLAKSVTVE